MNKQRLKLLIKDPSGIIDSAGISLTEADAQAKLVSRIADEAKASGLPAIGYTGIMINLDTRVVHTLTCDVRVQSVPIDTQDYHTYITWQADPNKTKVFCSCCGVSFYVREPDYMRPILCPTHKEKGERYTIIGAIRGDR